MLPPACLDLPQNLVEEFKPMFTKALIGYIDGACSESADSRE